MRLHYRFLGIVAAAPFVLLLALFVLVIFLFILAVLVLAVTALAVLLVIRPGFRRRLFTAISLLRRRAQLATWTRWNRSPQSENAIDYED